MQVPADWNANHSGDDLESDTRKLKMLGEFCRISKYTSYFMAASSSTKHMALLITI